MDRLTPVAVKSTEKATSLSLILNGYVQADYNILCPSCGMRFLFLLDPKDRVEQRYPSDEVRQIMHFLRNRIDQDHANDHPHRLHRS